MCRACIFYFDFLCSLTRFWVPTWAYVGHSLDIFRLLKTDLILKSFWHRFVIDFRSFCDSNNHCFALQIIRFRTHRSFQLGPRSWTEAGPPNPSQNGTEIESKRLRASIQNDVEKLSNFEVDFERNLAPTWLPGNDLLVVLGGLMLACFGNPAPGLDCLYVFDF